MRFAIYYAPAPHDPLHSAGAAWLGRDPETNATLAQPDAPGIAEATQEPRRYGFHCTLKPPFRLAAGRAYWDLARAAEALAAQLAPFDLPRLAVTDIGGFLALAEATASRQGPNPQLRFLADCCVEQLDDFRAPPSAAEMARRRRVGLSALQESMLGRWGYPHVFDAWFFHMTLTRRLSEAERRPLQDAAERHFAQVLLQPRRVTDICLFTQSASDAAFLIAERFPLLG
jgi:putative phosphonate metabolism protein